MERTQKKERAAAVLLSLSIEDIGSAWDFTPVESECRHSLRHFLGLGRPDQQPLKSRKVKVNFYEKQCNPIIQRVASLRLRAS